MAVSNNHPKKCKRRRPGEARKEQAKLLRKSNPCINLSAPSGTYEIDKFVIGLKNRDLCLPDWFPEQVPDQVKWLREMANEIGKRTIEKTRIEVAAIPEVFETISGSTSCC